MTINTATNDADWSDDATHPATQADYRELQAQFDQLQTELFNWRRKSASQAMQIATLAKEVDVANDRAGAIADERDALAAELEILAAFRDEVVGVMNNSQGVAGWHRNHTIATWDELFPVVPDNQSPAACLAQVRAEAGRAGYLQGHLDAAGSESEWNKKHSAYHADQYAERIQQGGA